MPNSKVVNDYWQRQILIFITDEPVCSFRILPIHWTTTDRICDFFSDRKNSKFCNHIIHQHLQSSQNFLHL